MKELNYKASGANKIKIAFAKRKQTLARVLGVFLFALITVSCVSADKSATALVLATVPVFMIGGKFKELQGEELKTFTETATAEDLAAYYNAKNDAARAELKVLIESKATKTDIDALKEQLANDSKEQMKQLNLTLKEYGLAIKKLSESEKADRSNQKTIKEMLIENIDKLKLLQTSNKGQAKDNEFTIKTAGNMMNSTNISGGNVPVEQRLSGLNLIPSRKVRLMDIVSRGTATSNVISWVYQANKDGSAGQTAEGATKNQIDFDLVVATQTLKKSTAYIKISTEMLHDVDFIETEIRNELMRELLKKVETQVYSGDNTGDNHNGISTVATAFAAGTFALAVDNANEIDVLGVAMNQIALAFQDEPTFILVHPSTITKLKMIKVSTTDRRYVDFQNRFVITNGQAYIDGVPVIGTTLVTAGTYLIGDFSKALVYDLGAVEINIGLDGNDWTKNMRTILAEWRGLTIVKNNDRTAFVKGTFATDIAALETA
jgi:HK97 family phage major capsid protein